MKTYTPTEGEKEVIRIIQAEKTNWEEGNVFVTDKVQYIMRNVIKKARKNYFGIFNQAQDPMTGREKIFVPMTEWTVETMLKNIDIDTKDIEVKARHFNAHLKAQVFRYILKKKLDDINFGKTLNRFLRKVAIDGSAALKAYKDDDGKLAIGVVDSLNFIADPSVECLEDSTGVLERNILIKPEFDELQLPNSEYVYGVNSIDHNNNDTQSGIQTVSEIPSVEVYERWGYFPLMTLTDNVNDKDKFFYGKAIVSGLGGNPVVHVLEKLEDEEFPYMEGKLKEVPNRRHGKGIAEMLFSIQAYINEVVNTRLNKARIVHMGLFKLRGNITPQQIKKLFTTGAVKLDNASDILPIETGSIDPSSYKDEEQANTWGSRVTGTTNEDEVQSNRPATNALIEQQGASKGYNLRIEDLMLEIGKFIQNKVLPIIKEELKSNKGDILRITGDPAILKKLDEEFVRNQVYNNIEALTPTEKQMMLDSGMDIDQIVEQGVQQIQSVGEDRYIPIIDELFDTEFDVMVVMSDENINRSVMAKMLQDTMGMLASSGMPIRETLKELYDTLGLDGEKLVEKMPEQAPQQIGAPQGQGPETVANSMPQPSQI